jgi:hypothetical protein
MKTLAKQFLLFSLIFIVAPAIGMGPVASKYVKKPKKYIRLEYTTQVIFYDVATQNAKSIYVPHRRKDIITGVELKEALLPVVQEKIEEGVLPPLAPEETYSINIYLEGKLVKDDWQIQSKYFGYHNIPFTIK